MFNCLNDCSYNYTGEIRTQISILEDSDVICDLLESIANENIPIDGYFYQDVKCDNNLFTFTVGNNKEQSNCDLRSVKCILEKKCIDYIESDTIRVSFSNNNPAILSKIYCDLNDILDIYSSYYSSCNGIYIETSDNCKAVKIINSLN